MVEMGGFDEERSDEEPEHRSTKDEKRKATPKQ